LDFWILDFGFLDFRPLNLNFWLQSNYPNPTFGKTHKKRGEFWCQKLVQKIGVLNWCRKLMQKIGAKNLDDFEWQTLQFRED
jgi:hypothetical protein